MLTKEELEDVYKRINTLQDRVIERDTEIKRLEKNQCVNCMAKKSKGKDYFYGDYVGGRSEQL